MPDWVGGDRQEHTRHEAGEGKADLPEVEAVDVFECKWEGAEEEVENAQEDGGEEAEVEAHWFEK